MIKIFISDDHQMIIDGLKSMLEGEEGIVIAGEALNGLGVLDYLKFNNCDVLLLDINMPEFDGIATTKEVKRLHPKVKVLILSMHNTKNFIEELMSAGAEGYILKNAGREELLTAILTISGGGFYYGSAIMNTIVRREQNKSKEISLSERENEIIKFIAQGFTTQEIAEKLFLSSHTIDAHRKRILFKLNVRNAAGIVKYALQNNLC